MVIRALDHVTDCYTWKAGNVIAGLIRDGFSRGEKVTLSFRDVSDIPSSFANAAFVSLLDSYSFEYIKDHLAITDATRQIIDMIKRRFAFETTHRCAA